MTIKSFLRLVAFLHLINCSLFFQVVAKKKLPNLCVEGPNVIIVPPGIFNCSIPIDISLLLQVNISTSTSAVMIQVHTLQELVELSYFGTEQGSSTGFHTGLLRYTTARESKVSWSVRTVSVNYTVNALFMITLYSNNDPVPGACNQEFTPENEPNLHFNGTPTSDLAAIKFADGNIGWTKGRPPPPCDASQSPALQLQYHMYIYYMPTKDYANDTMLEAVQKMMTPEGLLEHGQKVTNLTELNLKNIYVALFKNRGTVYNVLVYDPSKNSSSTYVPYVNYACDQTTNGSVLCTYTDMGPTMVYTFSGLLGTMLCFLGHWTFLYEMYMFGFLPSALGVYMLVAANTNLLPYGVMTVSISTGFLGGLVLMMLWWRFARVTPTALWISFVFAFQLSSVLFFTPFGYLSIWQDNTVFGLAFACSVLIPPIFGLVFQKSMSIIASAVIGSYMMIATLSFFLGGILHYITQNIIHRATQENFERAIVILPLNPIDGILAGLWCALVFLGVMTQKFLTREEKNFPACPYKAFKERRRLLHLGRREAPQTVLTSGRVNSSDNEITPLVGDL